MLDYIIHLNFNDVGCRAARKDVRHPPDRFHKDRLVMHYQR